ncbi:MAG: class I SAM-dependent methyltransferase [Deltaproteobacteria bacterium]|jgi:SAM-dependent methyltransferase|nr:class I SAM-dependent methyltransferase [Deltaproteobacteria bacterium]
MGQDLNDYHKYVIQDGRHIGDYETMWRECPDPWRIEELGVRLDMLAALLLLGRVPAVEKVLDGGAGSGLFTLEAARRLKERSPGFTLVVSDISPAALAKAETRLREADLGLSLHFRPFDLRLLGSRQCPWPANSFDLIILAQVLWGVADFLEGLFPALGQMLAPGGHLLMSQHFFQPGLQKYAADKVTCPERLIELAGEAGFELRHSLETDRHVNHHWAGLWISS